VAAAVWWRKAAAQEHAGAQFKLGVCLEKGDGVEQDHELAAGAYTRLLLSST